MERCIEEGRNGRSNRELEQKEKQKVKQKEGR